MSSPARGGRAERPDRGDSQLDRTPVGLALADPDSWPPPQVTTSTVTTRYGQAVAAAWDRVHPRLTHRAAWLDHDGDLPVIEGPGVAVAGLPGGRPGRWGAEARVGDQKISARDAEELAACYAADGPGLFGYACFVARGDETLADDLRQAAFEAACRAWCTVRCLPEGQRRSWLRTTLTNIAVSGFRRDAAFRDRLPRIEARYRKAQADTPVQALSAVALERCWQVIMGMPEREHAVALLRWQQDMKVGEIATALGISEKTVSTHLHRARRKLIAQLGPDYPFTSDDREGAPS